MEKKYEAVDEWMCGIVDIGDAFNARSQKRTPGLSLEVEREYRTFASLDLSNMGR